MSFIECDTCRAKPGTPTLCAGCHTNRKTISKVEKREADAYAMFEAENKARVDAVRKVAELEKEIGKMMPAYEAIEHVKDQRHDLIEKNENLKGDLRTAQEDAHMYLDQRNEARRERDELKRKCDPIPPDEQDVMTKLVAAWNAYVALDVMHPDEQTEFRHNLHACQHIILARVGVRAMNNQHTPTP